MQLEGNVPLAANAQVGVSAQERVKESRLGVVGDILSYYFCISFPWMIDQARSLLIVNPEL